MNANFTDAHQLGGDLQVLNNGTGRTMMMVIFADAGDQVSDWLL